MFATEPVTASLGSVLRNQDDDEKYGATGRADYSDKVNTNAGNARKSKIYEIDELEIQKGLLQIAKGLEFLNESAGLVHGNFCPEAIIINAKVCLASTYKLILYINVWFSLIGRSPGLLLQVPLKVQIYQPLLTLFLSLKSSTLIRDYHDLCS